MIFLELDLSLPIKNPVIIFSLVLFIILFAPILLNKLRIPHIIGLILAGVIIGPYGLNLLLRDSSIVLFGTVGLIYIMFTAALEIDLEEFRKNRYKSFIFGLFTFIIPATMGTLVFYWMLGFSIFSSFMMGALFASHTLLAYPIASRYGIARIRSVTLSIGGTIITDVLALILLATIAGMTRGEIGTAFWVRLGVSSVIFAGIIFFIFPLIARWFFKRFEDNISQYIFVLALVFLGSFMAEAAGLEAIIGAFLSGLALNRFIPHNSPLMNRIDFVGNALFIPFFLIGVGMLVDVSVLFKGLGALKVAGVMILVAVVGKYLAAWLTQKTFQLQAEERSMIFGLSNARVGATLAVVLVGYNIIVGESPAGEPLRLLSEDVLNGAIIMILVTCTISSLVVERASRKLAMLEEGKDKPTLIEDKQRILISVAYEDSIPDLVDLALMLKPALSKASLYALNVVDEDETGSNGGINSRKLMEKVVRHASATDNEVIPLIRYDQNISNGIIYSVKEHQVTDLVIGLHRETKENDSFFGAVAERILKKIAETIYVYKAVQPLNTLQRIVVAAPLKCEHEPGFYHWFDTLYFLARHTGLPMVVYASPETIDRMKDTNDMRKAPLSIQYVNFYEWDEFLFFSGQIRFNDLFIIVNSRKGHISYRSELEKIPYYLDKYFESISFIVLYPSQLGDVNLETDPIERSLIGNQMQENIEMINKAGKYVKRIFRREKE
ncbi:MAG TPA: cation:proton antiporter [Flavitalea sp.]|nr:cation:proton antiporter [Flavitalea sp.]